MATIDIKAMRRFINSPVDFTTHIIGATPDAAQRAIMESVAKNQMTSVRSGHGIGKSAVESWLVLWFLCTRPYPKIPCTAPTDHQLKDILWAEIAKWIRQSRTLENVIVWTQERVYLKGHAKEWFAVARTATKPDALQGFHAEHILYIIDEASGVDDDRFEPVLGSLSTPGAKLLMCGNPTRLTGFFHDSHTKNRAQYSTFHIDGRKSRRVSQDFINTIIEMYGENSDVFRVRVSGDFPKALPDSFIPMEWCERQSEADRPAREPSRIDIGVDVARFGDDSSVIAPVRDKTLQDEPDIYHHNDTMEIAGYTIAAIRQYASIETVREIYVKIDCDGLGVGVYDRLREQREEIQNSINDKRREAAEQNDTDPVPFLLEVYECHFGGEGGTVSPDDPVEYANSTGVMWGTVREALRKQTLVLWRDDRQITQLSNRRYSINSAGRIELERKEAMKKRGIQSPDIADALALAMYDPVQSDWSIDF